MKALAIVAGVLVASVIALALFLLAAVRVGNPTEGDKP